MNNELQYEDPEGYIVVSNQELYWFSNLTELFDTFGDRVEWDFENEVYIIPNENFEVDEELSNWLDEKDLPESLATDEL